MYPTSCKKALEATSVSWKCAFTCKAVSQVGYSWRNRFGKSSDGKGREEV